MWYTHQVLVVIGMQLYLCMITRYDTLNITTYECTHVYIHDYIPYYMYSIPHTKSSSGAMQHYTYLYV